MQTPDDSACWTGDWERIDPRRAIWAQSAVLRTVRALPGVASVATRRRQGQRWPHPAWCARRRRPGADRVSAFSHRTTRAAPVTAEPRHLDGPRYATGSTRICSRRRGLAPWRPSDCGRCSRSGSEATTRPYQEPTPGVRRWREPWRRFPVLATTGRDPPRAVAASTTRARTGRRSRWPSRPPHVHADDVRQAADLLAPHVTALILDHVADDAAITISETPFTSGGSTRETRQASGRCG